MEDKTFETEINIKSDEQKREESFDNLLKKIFIVAKAELDLQECKELLEFIRDFKELKEDKELKDKELKDKDDKELKDKIDKELKDKIDKELKDKIDNYFLNEKELGIPDYYNEGKNEYISKIIIQGIQSLKNEKITDPVQSIKFLYSEGLFTSVAFFLNSIWLQDVEKKYEGGELLKRRDAIWGIKSSIELQSMIDDLNNDTAFAEIKRTNIDVLEKMYWIGNNYTNLLEKNMLSKNGMPLPETTKEIYRQVARDSINNTRYLEKHKFEDIIRKIADEKYDNGYTDWHNNLAKTLSANLSSLQNGNQNKIQDTIFLKYVPELNTFDYKPYIKNDIIMAAIRDVAYNYKRVNGVHNTTKG